MLSRLVRPTSSILSNLNSQVGNNSIVGMSFVRCVTSGSKTTNQATAPAIQEGPERDLVNFPRPTRLYHPSPVRFGFLPDEWFRFFEPKTGVTGSYVFGAGLLTYVLSKEIWVLEHEFWGGVSLFAMIIFAVKKFGPSVSAYLDKEQDAYMENMYAGKNAELKFHNDNIAAEQKSQFEAEGMKMLFDIKRENVALQLEAAYRQRLMDVYSEVKRRLDYQVEKQLVERALRQKHMVNWVINSVTQSITTESESENLKKCISDLKGLAATVK